jgi:hypothetical protein
VPAVPIAKPAEPGFASYLAALRCRVFPAETGRFANAKLPGFSSGQMDIAKRLSGFSGRALLGAEEHPAGREGDGGCALDGEGVNDTADQPGLLCAVACTDGYEVNAGRGGELEFHRALQ